MNEQEDLPARIDRYEPLKRLAVGGMAEIFLAKQSGLEGFEKVVVLKRILPHLASDDEFVSMFLDEARIAAKLSHPNVVQIYDLGKADATYYIAMEYVSGRNVQHLITKQQQLGGHLPVEHVARIMAGVCDGLFYAHGRKDYDGKPLNIVHRDISPQNILVSFAGGVKVVDFGIAKASTQLAQTRAGVLKGKYAYMSPEQVRGAKVDHRSDIFALGLVMYEMLTGMRAFERDNSLKTLKAIVQEKPLNPREMNPDIPMEVVKLLSKALEKNPDRRYKTAQEMQLALEDWLESSPKKSNNVRLSRFLYDLFDDELNSAEGTLVVKGVGQVIIPTSQGKEAKPAIEEEVDSKTLSAALVDDRIQPGPATKPKAAPAAAPAPSARVRDEVGAKAAAAKPSSAPRTAPVLDDDDDSDDGKTVPGYDLEQLERDRQAAMALAQRGGSGPQRAAPAANNPLTAEGDDEDKTRAGVPMSVPSAPPSPALMTNPTPGRRRPSEDDVAAPTLNGRGSPAAAARTASLEQQPLQTIPLPAYQDPVPQPAYQPPQYGQTSDTPSQLAPQPGYDPVASPFNQPFTAAESQGRLQVQGMATQEGDPEQEIAPREDTQPHAILAAGPARRPPAFFAMVGAAAGMAAMSVLLFAVGALAFPAVVPAVDYGVVAVTTTPAGAAVVFEGTTVITPAQVVMPLDGQPRTVSISLPGYKERSEPVMFSTGANTAALNVTLEPQ